MKALNLSFQVREGQGRGIFNGGATLTYYKTYILGKVGVAST